MNVEERLLGANGERVKVSLRMPEDCDETRTFVSFWVGSDSWGTVSLVAVRRWAEAGPLQFRRGAAQEVGLTIPASELERFFGLVAKAQGAADPVSREPRLRLSAFAERSTALVMRASGKRLGGARTV